MLTINNPKDADARRSVAPFNMYQEQLCVEILNTYIKSQNTMLNGTAEAYIQRFIHLYENYRHFYEVAGGWDGLAKLQNVEYEVVKGGCNGN